MVKFLTLCSVLLAVMAPSALAGLDLTWHACNTTPGSTSDAVLDCAAPGGRAIDLFGCFQVDATQDSVVDIDCQLDLGYSADERQLGDFWHFESGACNDLTSGSAVLSTTRPDTLCSGPISRWNNQTQFGMGYLSSTPCRGRFYLSIQPQRLLKLLTHTNYFGFRITFRTDHAIENGTGQCVGCSDPVVLSWNAATVVSIRSDGTPNVVVTGAGFVSPCVTLNPGGFCGCNLDCSLRCPLVPVRNRTWGQLKSFYR